MSVIQILSFSKSHSHISTPGGRKYSAPAPLLRCLHQTAPQQAASAKHAPAFIDQKTVIQFMETWQLLAEHQLLRIFQAEVSEKMKNPSGFFPNREWQCPEGSFGWPNMRKFGASLYC